MIKEIWAAIFATWNASGWGPRTGTILTALMMGLLAGRQNLIQLAGRLGRPVSQWVADMPEFSLAWALIPLIVLILCGTGKRIRQLKSELGQRVSEKEKAFDKLAEEHNSFIDLVLNKDPPDEGLEQWKREYVNWRDNTIAPLVEKAVSSARAKTIIRFGGRLMLNTWDPNRSAKFNHTKSMLVQTLNEIEFIVRERR